MSKTPVLIRSVREEKLRIKKFLMSTFEPLMWESGFTGKLRIWVKLKPSGGTVKFKIAGNILSEFIGFMGKNAVITEAAFGTLVSVRIMDLPIEDLWKLEAWARKHSGKS